MTTPDPSKTLTLDLHACEVFGLAGALALLIADQGEADPQAKLREQAINALADVLPRHAQALHERIFDLELTEADLQACRDGKRKAAQEAAQAAMAADHPEIFGMRM
ncbi:MAG TPA: hypothetical protein PKD10_16175 [Paracoccaceae bacterium]|nr:hypothetical protein [Paracoccaceae bacterium]